LSTCYMATKCTTDPCYLSENMVLSRDFERGTSV
jgi:hypothetical protein